ncbi:FAD-dependent monooxygenase [Bradyrhizobium jicamae]|uniref:FAD-dependent monooxygenase n=1 Tax=Bradyrhizobium jicamae TaxID=280332 RepID=A0ABS5FMF7_9BRAD|nr:FAD-dependent monooxygenase [Bradyrhizobium jicamae]MBR0797989.1 FAD-dependent monooxygenase [Bradyrhizobium jicamae]
MAHLGKHAIVVGAGMGGLLAARALADHFDEVTVLERDALSDSLDPRKGVPQGRHTHGLLARGREILEQLFPGFTDGIIAQGAVPADIVNDGLWFNYGVYLHNAPSKMVGLGVSRPTLECFVRKRLVQLPNVQLQQRRNVVEPVFDRSLGRVIGVRVQLKDGSDEDEILEADLVVDASGRGSSSAAWLSAVGFAKPPEEQITVNVGYVTRFYRLKPEHMKDHLYDRKFVIMGACSPDFRFGALLPQEGKRWTVTLGGYMHDQVPVDDASFLEFASRLQKPEISNLIRTAEPLTPLTPYKFVSNTRRHYEKLARVPEGYLVYGDALCSFDPIYGQGMTVACVESLALRECLARGMSNIGPRFFQMTSRLIEAPWQIAVGSDLQNPSVEGTRTTQVRFVNWYISKFYRAAQRDAVLANKFLEVANLMQQPTTLLSPANALRVWSRSRDMKQRDLVGSDHKAA